VLLWGLLYGMFRTVLTVRVDLILLQKFLKAIVEIG
jgi:hypothetical protein